MFYLLYKLLYASDSAFSFVRVFKYLSVRAIGAVITGFIIYLLLSSVLYKVA